MHRNERKRKKLKSKKKDELAASGRKGGERESTFWDVTFKQSHFLELENIPGHIKTLAEEVCRKRWWSALLNLNYKIIRLHQFIIDCSAWSFNLHSWLHVTFCYLQILCSMYAFKWFHSNRPKTQIGNDPQCMLNMFLFQQKRMFHWRKQCQNKTLFVCFVGLFFLNHWNFFFKMGKAHIHMPLTSWTFCLKVTQINFNYSQSCWVILEDFLQLLTFSPHIARLSWNHGGFHLSLFGLTGWHMDDPERWWWSVSNLWKGACVSCLFNQLNNAACQGTNRPFVTDPGLYLTFIATYGNVKTSRFLHFWRASTRVFSFSVFFLCGAFPLFPLTSAKLHFEAILPEN